jgi:hypothetical protein
MAGNCQCLFDCTSETDKELEFDSLGLKAAENGKILGLRRRFFGRNWRIWMHIEECFVAFVVHFIGKILMEVTELLMDKWIWQTVY